MFNSQKKEEALKFYKNCLENYNSIYADIEELCSKLYYTKLHAVDVISDVEALVNSIANTPLEFNKIFEEIELEKNDFRKTEEIAKQQFDDLKKVGYGEAAAAAGGAAIAGVGPTVAMGIATTFGHASTGAAIAALHGAAQTSAALAWLGGGALTAGGGGMAAGNALLALAGPIGWGIAIAGVAGGTILVSHKNKVNAEKAEEAAGEIRKATAQLKETEPKIVLLGREIDEINDVVTSGWREMSFYYGGKYELIDETNQKKLATLYNNTLALAELINKTI